MKSPCDHSQELSNRSYGRFLWFVRFFRFGFFRENEHITDNVYICDIDKKMLF